ncbi:putative ABC transport system ATP-binding protein [Lentibacillus persicus]|uniref:Putative ABC transport system ATP-binding protein n=1 Tax=Lentibacillus persicus TaxID=640948 RepID=A0A1I1XB17_9BACI|nr:ABC transporter ATP-binding protein [Lentibacillus persicus]SFE02923.1 putative ABC transport system ATP-binding protein [Lentibacillus persicus]
MIQLQSISKSYPVGRNVTEVLKDIDLIIQQSEFAAIMGPSGSGKTTLMNIIGCLDHATSGSYYLNEKLVTGYSEKEVAHIRNRDIGFVFQQFHLLPRLSALQNVELPMIYAGIRKKERRQKARDALHQVGLSDYAVYAPNELSGGQKQRVAIARAIVNQPDLILADEPTGALDTTTGKQVMAHFKQLNKEGTTIIVVTHEPGIAGYADRVITIQDGLLLDGNDIGRSRETLT